MRAPAFWWDEPGVASALLSPLGMIYGAVAARRLMQPGTRIGVPVICVGNPTVGGAGKTPTAIAIADLLIAAGEKPMFLTRGYGGRLAGPLKVEASRPILPLTHRFVEAAQQAGFPFNPDLNGKQRQGVGYSQMTRRGRLDGWARAPRGLSRPRSPDLRGSASDRRRPTDHARWQSAGRGAERPVSKALRPAADAQPLVIRMGDHNQNRCHGQASREGTVEPQRHKGTRVTNAQDDNGQLCLLRAPSCLCGSISSYSLSLLQGSPRG